MRFEAQTFWLAKDLQDSEQYQDAFTLDAQRGRAAIADGVTSAIFSGPWARILTQATVEDPPAVESVEFADWLTRQRAAWRGQIDTSKLAWHQKPKLIDGAMSTLLWIDLQPTATENGQPTEEYILKGYAIGDGCLFHLREEELLMAFPMSDSAAFGLNPSVLVSVDRKQDHLIEFHSCEIRCLPGDLLVLCTDAIALWAMTEYEAGATIDWRKYWDASDETWREDIVALRDAARIDDSTLLLLRVVPETSEIVTVDSDAARSDIVNGNEDPALMAAAVDVAVQSLVSAGTPNIDEPDQQDLTMEELLPTAGPDEATVEALGRREAESAPIVDTEERTAEN